MRRLMILLASILIASSAYANNARVDVYKTPNFNQVIARTFCATPCGPEVKAFISKHFNANPGNQSARVIVIRPDGQRKPPRLYVESSGDGDGGVSSSSMGARGGIDDGTRLKSN